MLNNNEVWSLVNRLFSLFANSIILFLIAKHLESQSVALWYLFLAIFGIVGIVEGGFMQTVSRHITYITSGFERHKEINVNEFITINISIFMKIVLFILILSLLFGSIYISNLDNFKLTILDYFSWILFILSSVIALVSNLYSSIALGFQKVSEIQKNQIVSTSLNLISVIMLIGFLDKKNLLSIVISYLAAQLLLLFLNRRLAKRYFFISKNKLNKQIIIDILLNDMKKMSINIISYKLLTSFFFAILAAFISVDLLASYGITFQIITYILSFSTLFITSNIPYFASLYGKKSIKKLNHIYMKKVSIVFLLTFIGFFLIYFLFPFVQDMMELKTSIFGQNLLKYYLLMVLIELVITVFSSYLLVSNDLRYTYYSFIGSLTIVISTYCEFKYYNLSMDDIFLSRTIISIFFIFGPIAILTFRKQQKEFYAST